MTTLSLHVYDSTGKILQDKSQNDPQQLRFSTGYPGGLCLDASWFLPRDIMSGWALLGGNTVRIYSGPELIWEGKVGSLSFSAATEAGVIVPAWGYWGYCLQSVRYRKPWVDTRITEEMWIPIMTVGKPDKFTFDNNERLHASPNDVKLSYLDYIRFAQYNAPTGQTIKRVTFDYDFSENALTTANKIFGYTPAAYTDLTNTYDDDDTTSNTYSFAATSYLYIALDEKFYMQCNFFRVDLGATVNANASVMTAEYYAAGGWTALAITDGTIAVAGKTMSGDGDITFTGPTDWAKGTVNSVSQYWIRLSFSNALTNNIVINEIRAGEIQAWRLALAGSGGTEWSVTATATGAVNLNLVTPSAYVYFYLQSMNTAAQYGIANGTVFGTITNTAVYTELGNINLTEICKDIIPLDTRISSDESWVGSNTQELTQFVMNGETLAEGLITATLYGDVNNASWAVGVGMSTQTSDGKPPLFAEKWPVLTDWDYTIDFHGRNVEGLEIDYNFDDIVNYIWLLRTDENGHEVWRSPADDATLTDANSVATFGRKDYTLDAGNATAADALLYAKRFLARFKDPHYGMVRPVTVKGWIDGKLGSRTPAANVRAGKRLMIANPVGGQILESMTSVIVRTDYDADSNSVTIETGLPQDIALWWLRKQQRFLTRTVAIPY